MSVDTSPTRNEAPRGALAQGERDSQQATILCSWRAFTTWTELRGTRLSVSSAELPPPVAHCHLGLGKLFRRTGKVQKAQEHLTTATTMYGEMGMTYWLEQAEVELQALA